jgi:hypothetical protein
MPPVDLKKDPSVQPFTPGEQFILFYSIISFITRRILLIRLFSSRLQQLYTVRKSFRLLSFMLQIFVCWYPRHKYP